MIYNLNYDTICLGGGGPNGASFISILEVLSQKKIINLKKINKFVGTSIGSMISLFLVLGYKINELKEFCLNFNFQKLEQEADCDIFFNSYGLNDGKKFIILLNTFIYQKYKKNDLTFKELYNLTNKKLYIIATNYTKAEEIVFNEETTPDLLLTKAIRMSISLPILFTPIYYKNDIIIDGGFSNNLGLNYCNSKTTLSITAYSEENKNPENIINYLFGLKRIIEKLVNVKYLNCEFKKNMINVKSPDPGFKISPSKENILKLVENGHKIALNFINNKPEIFCRDIINKIISEF